MGPQVPTHTYRPRPRGARLAVNRVVAAVVCLGLACGAWALLRPAPAPAAAALSARLADAAHRVLRDGDLRQAQRLAAAALTAGDTPQARSAAMAALAAPLHASTSASAGDDGAEVVAQAGDTVATAGATGVVRVWRVQDVAAGGVTLARVGGPLPGSDRRVTSLALSPDGRSVVAGADDGTARLWSLGDAGGAPRAPRVVRAHDTRVTAVAFVPGTRGRWATAGLDGRLRYWDLRGRPVADHPGFAPREGADPVEGITTFAFTAGGSLVVIGGDTTRVAVRTVADGRLWTPRGGRASGGLRNGTGHPAAAIAVAGDRLAIGFGTGEIALWRRTAAGFSPDAVTLERPGKTLDRLAFSPAGDLLVAGGERLGARLWTLPAGVAATPVPGLPLGGDAVRDVTFLGRGHVAALRAGGTLQVWDTDVDQPLGRPLATPRDGATGHVAFGPRGDVVAATTSGGRVWFWDVADGRIEGRPLALSAGISDVAFSPPGDGIALVLTGDERGAVRRWNAGTRTEVRPALEPADAEARDEVTGLAVAPDGRTVAVGHRSGHVRLWDYRSREPAPTTLTGHTAAVTAADVSGTGRLLATAAGDGTIRVWDLDGDPRLLHVIPTGRDVGDLAFVPGTNRLASASDDGVVRLWDASTGERAGPELPGVAAGLAVSPDGATLVTTSDDGSVRAWDLATGALVGEPMAGHDAGAGVAFAPPLTDRRTRGGLAATAGEDGAVRLWDVDRRHWLDALCRRGGRDLDAGEWRTYAGDVPHPAACG
jgi:WD40 repeat protein